MEYYVSRVDSMHLPYFQLRSRIHSVYKEEKIKKKQQNIGIYTVNITYFVLHNRLHLFTFIPLNKNTHSNVIYIHTNTYKYKNHHTNK